MTFSYIVDRSELHRILTEEGLENCFTVSDREYTTIHLKDGTSSTLVNAVSARILNMDNDKAIREKEKIKEFKKNG